MSANQGETLAAHEKQKRIVIDGEDFYIDLLFYHRRLRRLIAIDLKIGKLGAAHKGQLEHAGVDRVFTDKASGKDTQRPHLEALFKYVREGDTVVVHSMDRLARNVVD